jgi:hypothetical protein
MDKWEVIVEFGTAGKKILLSGRMLGDNKWMFKFNTQEYALEDTLDEEDNSLLASEIQSIGDWNEAIRLMSRYPWKSMCPNKIHPMFKVFLWDKINYDKEYEDCSVRWYTKCFIPEEDEELEYGETCEIAE